MSNKRDSDHEMDIYIIPQNFIEGGKVFGGMFRFRNAVEAIVLAVISGYPIMASSANLYPKIILMCCIPLPLTLFGLIGIGDDSLTEFIINFFVWLRRRRILGEEPDIPYEEKPAKWYRPQWLMSAVKAVRAKMPFRKVEADEADYEIVYYDSEDEIPPDAARWDDFQNKELPVMLRTPVKQKKEKRKKRGNHKKNGKSKAKTAAAKDKKGKGKKKPASKRPDKAQTMEEFLPIDKIENGIVHTKDGRYIRILEIEPINFLLRSPREQRNIIFSFASMLKITPIKLQFKVISKKADVNQHLNTMRKHMSKEEDPRVRELQQDYFNLIRRIGSREAVTRRFFMIFEYQNPLATRRVEYKEIVAMLETTTRNARSYLAQCGNEVVQHENEDEFISEVFYTLLNRKTSVNTPLQERVTQTLAKYIVEDGDRNMDDVTVNELIAPTSLDLTHSRYLIMDNLYYSYLIIPADAYKTQVVAGWLSLIVNAGEGIDCDLYFHKEPKERVQMKIGQQIRINRSKIKDTSDTNTDFDDLDNAIRSGYYLKRGISNNEDFYYLSIIISICASNLRDLDWRVAEMKKLLISQDMDARVCNFQQENAFLSTLPIAAIDKKLYAKSRRNLLTTSAASCYPFTSFEMSDDAGILMGVNKFNNSMIIVDIFNSKIYKNANIAILGASGAGKTFTMQLMALRMRMKGIQVFVLPPLKGHEFRRACTNSGGEFISISPASKNCINVMEIRKVDNTATELLDGQTDRSELAGKIQKLHIFFSLLIPDMSYEEKQLLDEAIVRCYHKKGITHDNSTLDDPENPGQYKEMPLLGDLYEILLESPETKRLANILNRMVHGSASTFNQHTNVNLDNLYTVIDISELSGDLLGVGMFVGLDYMWDKAKEDRTKEKVIFIPEAWKLIGSGGNELTANYVLEMAKIIRGYGGSLVVDTQDISDFFALQDGKFGRGVINACKTKIILGMEDEEAMRVQDILRLTDTELTNITHFQRGSGLISTNNNNVTVEFKCSEYEKSLITTDRNELSQLLEKKRAAQEQGA